LLGISRNAGTTIMSTAAAQSNMTISLPASVQHRLESSQYTSCRTSGSMMAEELNAAEMAAGTEFAISEEANRW
jgi:hypothetical protein